MELDSQEYWDWRYRELLPDKFWLRSGVKCHSFRILDPYGHSLARFRRRDGTLEEIEDSACCSVMFQGRFRRILIPFSRNERLFEAVVFLGQTFRSGTRVTRYLNLYKSYESIATSRNAEFAAVRHALGHSGAALTRPVTVGMLNRMFGGTYINLDIYKHSAELYRVFGRMLIENDRLLFDAIMRQFPDWTRVDVKSSDIVPTTARSAVRRSATNMSCDRQPHPPPSRG